MKNSHSCRYINELPNLETLQKLFIYHKSGYLIRRSEHVVLPRFDVIYRRFDLIPYDGKIRRAGAINSRGYRTIGIGNKKYYEHRLIWKLCNGKDPDGEIDHINRNPLDNRIENLRECSNIENAQNRNIRVTDKKNNPYMGVFFYKKLQMYRAMYTYGGKKKTLGFFATPEIAAFHRDIAVRNKLIDIPLNFEEAPPISKRYLQFIEYVKSRENLKKIKEICEYYRQRKIHFQEMKDWYSGKRNIPIWVIKMLNNYQSFEK